LRQEIAQQAARMLAEGLEIDYLAAKSKAAKKLGYSSQQDLPSNVEVENEVKSYQALFLAETHSLVIKNKRLEALSAMQYFEQFEPRLVGSVLAGTASENHPIEIELFADSLKDVTFFLIDANIPYEMGEHQVRVNKRESKQVPVVYFSAGDHEVELRVFSFKDLKQNHLSPITGQAEPRASVKKVQALLAEVDG